MLLDGSLRPALPLVADQSKVRKLHIGWDTGNGANHGNPLETDFQASVKGTYQRHNNGACLENEPPCKSLNVAAMLSVAPLIQLIGRHASQASTERQVVSDHNGHHSHIHRSLGR